MSGPNTLEEAHLGGKLVRTLLGKMHKLGCGPEPTLEWALKSETYRQMVAPLDDVKREAWRKGFCGEEL